MEIQLKGAKKEIFKAKMLITADGSTSTIAQSLGIVKSLRETKNHTICSTVYIEAGTHTYDQDPLTGGCIQYAMDAGTIAAEEIAESFEQNDLSKEFLSRYQKKCMKKFGNDHKWSLKMARYFARHPIFIDAFAAASIKQGDEFMAKWAQIMCEERPKREFLRPKLTFLLIREVIKLKLKKKTH